MIQRIKNLIKWAKEPEGYIEIVFCQVCGYPRSNLEWQARGKNGIYCKRCFSNRVTGGSTSARLKIKMLIRYVLKGY